MTNLPVALSKALASDITDRAFRLYAALLFTGSHDWSALTDLANSAALTSHEARGPLLELCTAGLTEKERRWVPELKTHRAYVRLLEAVAPAPAGVAA
ncbi:hypothetical protein ABZ468_07810 [Streptomyces sp. NPDC005708]|uniref:hypothetical protein n=1 Tax=Streptomyces sp. NPDC005708 TaxID=3154564 RepID=UPI00340AC5E0